MGKILKSKPFLIAGDIIIFYLSFVLAIWLRHQKLFSYQYFYENLIKFSILLIIWLLVFYTLNLYHLNKFHSKTEYLKKQIIAVIVLTVISTLFFYWYPQYSQVLPKTILLLFAVSFLILWIGMRMLVFFLLSKAKETYLIIGSSHKAHKLFEELLAYGPQNKKIFIYSDAFLLNSDSKTAQIVHPPSGNLQKIIKSNKIDKIIFDKEFPQAQETINFFFSQIDKIKSEFYELHDFFETFHQKITLENLDKGWFIYNLRPGQSLYLAGKKIFDLSCAFVGTFFFTAIFPIISILIKIDSKGPVIYKQERIGQNKRVFYIYKFRTMTHTNDNVQVCAAKEDKRVTKTGKYLRKLHLDETPQFLNILKGDLSLVGPRPEQPLIVEQLSNQIPYYNQRHLIKPGMTGWAQINYPYCTTLQEHRQKLQYDLYYLKRKSFILDMKILIKTINKIFFPR